MSRPGWDIHAQSVVPNTTPSINTGTWFAVGQCTAGPVTPQLISNFQQYQEVFGGRGTFGVTISDAVEAFFREGGSRVYVCRVVGAGAVTASVKVNDKEAKPSVKFEASGAGTWANKYKIVVAGTEAEFTVTVKNANEEVVLSSPVLGSLEELTNWAKGLQSEGTKSPAIYIKVVSEGTKSPTAGTSELTGGTDESAKVEAAQYEAGLALFTSEYGPGQVSVPGVTTEAVQKAVFAHALKLNRIALVDTPDTKTVATLESQSTPIRALAENAAGKGSLCAPWVSIPALVGTVPTRSCPPSPLFAAACSKVDALGNPNLAPAGENGKLNLPVELHATFTDSEREALNKAGVCVIKNVYGQPRIYGFRTAVNAEKQPLYTQLPNVRLDMAVVAEAQQILERFFGSDIDGQGLDAAAFCGELSKILTRYYKVGALYGNSAQEAFNVVSGETAQAASEGNLVATISMRRSPGAEHVELNIVRVPVTQEV